MKNDKTTAAELMARLESDPAFVATRDAREAQRQADADALRLELAPVLADLRATGCDVTAFDELTQPPHPRAARWPEAVPVLLAHLEKSSYSPRARTVLAMALGVPEARTMWDRLRPLYEREPSGSSKDMLANAIVVAAGADRLGEVIALLRDRRHGTSRVLLLAALTKSRDVRASDALAELRTDPDLVREIEATLARR